MRQRYVTIILCQGMGNDDVIHAPDDWNTIAMNPAFFIIGAYIQGETPRKLKHAARKA